MNASDMDEVVREFLVETYENLDRTDRELVALDAEPTSAERIATVFRAIHTIKGTCGFLGFTRLEAVSHAGESVLARLRDGERPYDGTIAAALLGLLDAIREILGRIAATGSEGDGDYSALVEMLTRLQEPGAAPPPVSVAPARAATAADAAGHAVTDSTVRVDVALLDRLMNLVGELVLARNQILESATAADATVAAAAQRLNAVTSALQEGVMKTRMQPIANVFDRFRRVVRDLAAACGKQVRLEIEGRHTELDRTVIEAIRDPLTHIVRNAVDHGIETPAERVAAGKPAEGRLVLRAFHEGGLVNVEVRDDGRGIDPARIREAAVRRGIVTAARAAGMTDRELVGLVFAPGFSTAETVTTVSGRGVGLDVVRTNIEKIGGVLDVQSRPGEGTTLRAQIPLTLAIIPALIVTAGGERYAIPQASLLELVRLDADAPGAGVETILGAPVHRLRGDLLPLVHLGRVLRLEDWAPGRSATTIVVLQADDRRFGLVVDRVSDTAEIVVKPLGKPLSDIPVFAGASIMGDGRVAVILDVLGLARLAHVVSEERDPLPRERAAPAPATTEQRRPLLLIGAGDGGRLAIPLSTVARLEEFARDAVERAGGREVMQYRGRILPLVRLADVLGGGDGDPERPLQVVVYTEGGRSVGLVVDRVLDIVDDTVALEGGGRAGMLGSAIVRQRVTDLLDVAAIIRAADPALFDDGAA